MTHKKMTHKKWTKLRADDLVEVITPGMEPTPEAVRQVENLITSWGLRVRFGKNLRTKDFSFSENQSIQPKDKNSVQSRDKNPVRTLGKPSDRNLKKKGRSQTKAENFDFLCAGPRENRFKDLKKALLAEDSKMIWCLRGGYGSLQLLESLKTMIPPRKAKLFVGLSDITSLHIFFTQCWGWSTLHGCNGDRLSSEQATKTERNRFKKVLFGKTEELIYPLKPMNSLALETKNIPGTVIGGNLTTLQSSLGTGFQLDGRGVFLFFEEVGERAYRVDRILEQMKQAGIFKNPKAIIFGPFTDCLEPGKKNLIPLLLKRFALEVQCPVYLGIKSGHGLDQQPLPLGTEARIICKPKPKILIKTGVQ